MKIVLNTAFGGFIYGVAEQYKDLVRELESKRTSPELIDFVETHPDECGDLEVVEIPDKSTDWYIDEYDGFESLIYVVDGKIHRK